MKKNTTNAAVMSLFDGKVCTKCRVWKPFSDYSPDKINPAGYVSACKPCRNAVTKASRQKNVEEYRERSRKQYAGNRDARLASTRKWRDKNAERRREYDRSEAVKKRKRELYDLNRTHKVEVNKRWRHSHPEACKLNTLRYKLKDPQAFRAMMQAAKARRRALEFSAEGTFTKFEWQQKCNEYDNRCACCRVQASLHADHIVPLTKGGSNLITNIQPLCKRCNSRKHAKTIYYPPLSNQSTSLSLSE